MPYLRDLGLVPRAILAALLVAALALPFIVTGDAHLLKLATRIVILALAASALDLALGTGGLVSFGHAAFLGLGGYVVGIMFHHDFEGTSFLGLPPTQNLLVLLPAAMLASALFALLTGAICLRTRGVSFIMITLAFAQMLYFLFLSLRVYNGQDGIALWSRSHLAGLLDLESQRSFYWLCLGLLLLYLVLAWRLQHSPFGRVLRGAKDNEGRMAALGYPVFRYRLVAYTISGAVTGLAGALLANAGYFVSPSFLSWQHSGDLIVMVVLGGMGTVIGPVLGAMAYLLLEELLPLLLGLFGADWSVYWRLVLGPLLVLLALTTRQGLAGLLLRPKSSPARQAAPLSAEVHG
jgi:branched-chain amino acid transport system permease protein